MDKNKLLIDALDGTPRDLQRLLKPVDDAASLARPSLDMWCTKDVVAHLACIEPLYLARLKRIVEQDNPFEPYLHPDASAHDLTKPLHELIAGFTAKRAETIAFLAGLTHQQWLRTCVHETYGLTKLRKQVEILIGHDNNHLAQIVEIREYLDKHGETEKQRQ
jgi:hypothetical protein